MNNAGIVDLAMGFHRLRNAAEDYEFLIAHGVPQAEALDRTGLDLVAYTRYLNRHRESGCTEPS